MLSFRIGCFFKISSGEESEGFANKRLQCHMIIAKAAGCVLFAFRALVPPNQSATVFCRALRGLVSSFVRWLVIVHVSVGLVMSYADYA